MCMNVWRSIIPIGPGKRTTCLLLENRLGKHPEIYLFFHFQGYINGSPKWVREQLTGSHYYSSLLIYDRYHSHSCASFPSPLTDHSRSRPTCPKHPGITIVNCGQSARRIASQVPWEQYMVTWASLDNHATTRHEGRLTSRPPRRWTWALGVPTPVSCYSCSIYIIDVPFQAPGPVGPHLPSFPIRRLVVCVPVPCSSCRPPSPSCGQPP